MNYKGFDIELHDRAIGPAHDPYNLTTLIVTILEDGRRAEMVYNSLGAQKLRLTAGSGLTISDEESFSDDLQFLENKFKDFVGITALEAKEIYERNWEPDPYGSLSRYI